MIGVGELFKIGIGPSSSHTVGPMKAAKSFAAAMAERTDLAAVKATLFGSLAWTGKGHGSDKAVLLGLAGFSPESLDPDQAEPIAAQVEASHRLRLDGRREITFAPETDIVLDMISETPHHPNTLAFQAFDANGNLLAEQRWCSVGGGFVLPEAEVDAPVLTEAAPLPYPFRTARGLLKLCTQHGLSIAQIVRANEGPEVDALLDRLIAAMMACIERGLDHEGELPGGLKVKRRAHAIHQRLLEERQRNQVPPHAVMDWVSIYAMAVNEENAAGGRVVTAPTNGAAGVVPAVLRYYRDHCPGATHDGLRDFLLTATAVGGLFKLNASISGAEVGCQGEVGSASSMAAGGLAAALGGSPAQVENAAEIAMEHHLGMTCDPIAGLVQVPCIERNAFGAVTAINAASLALRGDGTHLVTLDQVIATMRETGADMASKYRETSQGGLAVNYVAC